MLIVCGAVNIDAYLDNVKYVVYNVVYIPFNLCYIFYVLPFHIIFIIKQTFNLKQYTRHHLLRELIIFQEIFLPLSMSVEDWNMSGMNWKWITLLKIIWIYFSEKIIINHIINYIRHRPFSWLIGIFILFEMKRAK